MASERKVSYTAELKGRSVFWTQRVQLAKKINELFWEKAKMIFKIHSTSCPSWEIFRVAGRDGRCVHTICL